MVGDVEEIRLTWRGGACLALSRLMMWLAGCLVREAMRWCPETLLPDTYAKVLELGAWSEDFAHKRIAAFIRGLQGHGER